MKFGLYAIRDQLVGFMNPTTGANDEAAIRSFHSVVNDQQATLISTQPQYYDLYKLADYDEETGEITPCKQPVLLVTGLSIKKGNEDNGVQK